LLIVANKLCFYGPSYHEFHIFHYTESELSAEEKTISIFDSWDFYKLVLQTKLKRT